MRAIVASWTCEDPGMGRRDYAAEDSEWQYREEAADSADREHRERETGGCKRETGQQRRGEGDGGGDMQWRGSAASKLGARGMKGGEAVQRERPARGGGGIRD